MFKGNVTMPTSPKPQTISQIYELRNMFGESDDELNTTPKTNGTKRNPKRRDKN